MQLETQKRLLFEEAGHYECLFSNQIDECEIDRVTGFTEVHFKFMLLVVAGRKREYYSPSRASQTRVKSAFCF